MRHRVLVDSSLLVLAAAAVLATVLPIPEVRPFLVIAAALVLPGAAIVTRLRVQEPIATAALIISLSLAVDTAGALLLVWTGSFHPGALAADIVGASSALIFIDLCTGTAQLRGRLT